MAKDNKRLIEAAKKKAEAAAEADEQIVEAFLEQAVPAFDLLREIVDPETGVASENAWFGSARNLLQQFDRSLMKFPISERVLDRMNSDESTE